MLVEASPEYRQDDPRKAESPRVSGHENMTRSFSFSCHVASIVTAFLAFTTSLCFAQNSPESVVQTDKDYGVMVDGVTAGGPAAKARISTHDIIAAIEGSPVRSLEQIVEALARHKPGDTMEVTVLRASDGAMKKVQMTLGANPIDPSQPYMGLTVTVGYMLLVPEGEIPPVQRRPPPGTRTFYGGGTSATAA